MFQYVKENGLTCISPYSSSGRWYVSSATICGAGRCVLPRCTGANRSWTTWIRAALAICERVGPWASTP